MNTILIGKFFRSVLPVRCCTNFGDILFRQPPQRWMWNVIVAQFVRILTVFRNGTPLQVFQSVIGADAVQVSSNLSRLFMSTVCSQHEQVDSPSMLSSISTKGNMGISICHEWLQALNWSRVHFGHKTETSGNLLPSRMDVAQFINPVARESFDLFHCVSHRNADVMYCIQCSNVHSDLQDVQAAA